MSDASTLPATTPPAMTEYKVRVLMVDDQPMIIEAVRRLLAGQLDIEFHHVTDATAAEARAEQIAPTVILQDLVMPELDGFALIGHYRRNPKLRHVPVIVLSAKEDAKLKAHGYEAGANDYLVKLPDQLELLARVRYHAGGYINRLQRDEALALLGQARQQVAELEHQLHQLKKEAS